MSIADVVVENMLRCLVNMFRGLGCVRPSYQAAIALGSAALVEVLKLAGRIRTPGEEAERLQGGMRMAWHVTV